MQLCGHTDRRPASGVRCIWDVERLGHCSYPHALGETAGARDVRLDDVHRLAVEDLAESEAGELRFAASNRHVERASHLCIPIEIVRCERLFEPGEVEFLQSAR